MASSASTGTKVFISYSHADREWLERLQRHLKPLVREGLDCWDDTHIRPGDDWKQEIRAALDRAQVAVLLISADFFASDFIDENELPPLLVAAQAKGVRILPVILSASRFTRDPSLARFQAVNSPDRPLNNMPLAEQEKVLDRLAQAIEGTVRDGDYYHWPDRFLSYPVRFIQDLFALITGPKRFIDERSKAKALKIGPALGFLATTKLVLWPIPPYTNMNVIAWVASNTVFLFAEVFIFLTILLLAWRIAGGKATFSDYLPIYLYYKAIFGFLIEVGNKIFFEIVRISDQQLYRDFMNAVLSGNGIRFVIDKPDRMASVGWIWIVCAMLYLIAIGMDCRRLGSLSEAQ
jgi:TIR domain